MKGVLHDFLKDNINDKAIICVNVAKQLTDLQDEVRIWMTDPKKLIHGTTVFVVGPEDTEQKKLYTVSFMSHF